MGWRRTITYKDKDGNVVHVDGPAVILTVYGATRHLSFCLETRIEHHGAREIVIELKEVPDA